MDSPKQRPSPSPLRRSLKVSHSLQELRLPQINSKQLKKTPGPADYSFSTFAGLACPSFSKKGFGSLISRCPRFQTGLGGTPGPGSYDFEELKAGSVSICSPFARRFSPKATENFTPAPGDYSPRVIRNVKNCASSFISKSKRMEIPTPVSPSPWHYCPEGLTVKNSGTEKNSGKARLNKTENDKKNAKRRESGKLNDSLVNKSCENLKSLKNVKSKHDLNPLKPSFKGLHYNLYNPLFNEKIETTPGPGMYEVQAKWTKKKVKVIEKEVKTVKFNKIQSPGPGSYLKELENAKEEAYSSFFVSKVPRELRKKKVLAPGPAYYSPKYLSKKISFVLNTQAEWI